MAGNRFLRQAWAIGGIAALALAATGCASTAHPPTGSAKPDNQAAATTKPAASTPGTVAQALAALPATSWGDTFIAFGQSATMTTADNTSSPSQSNFGDIVFLTDPLAAAPDSQLESQQTALLGFDPQKADYSLTMGTAPQTATVLYGTFPVSSIETKLAATGYTRHSAANGDTVWTYRATGSNPTTYPQDGDVTVPYAIDVSASRITIGYTTADLEAITKDAPTTPARAGSLDALATCLGSPTAGMINTLSETPAPVHALPAGIGITATTGNANVELCVQAPDTTSAQTMQASWANQIRTGHDPTGGEPWAEALTNPQASIASTTQHVVRFTATMAKGESASFFLDRYLGGGITTLIIPPTGTTA
jgi:hypothetical protein